MESGIFDVRQKQHRMQYGNAVENWWNRARPGHIESTKFAIIKWFILENGTANDTKTTTDISVTGPILITFAAAALSFTYIKFHPKIYYVPKSAKMNKLKSIIENLSTNFDRNVEHQNANVNSTLHIRQNCNTTVHNANEALQVRCTSFSN